MKTLLLVILSILIITGCKAKRLPKDLKKDFTNCFEDTANDIRSLIEIDGYYLMQKLERYYWGPENNYKDTFDINMIFYEDGTFVYNFFSKNNYPEDIPGYLKMVAQNGDSAPYYSGFYWGIYKLSGDTIVAQYINHTVGVAPWDAREKWFEVINRNTIKSIYVKQIGKEMSEQEIKNYKESVSKCLPAKFIPLEIIPPPNCWLKNEEWFWCKNRN
jgi:hypothetical protein